MGKQVKFPGISEELQKILDADMDNVEARRRARDAFKHIQLSIDHILFKVPHDGLKMEESYEVNSRGLEIFSKSWLPEARPKAIIYFCHGYGDTCTFLVEGIARKLASFGYGVVALDYPGFGLSEGLHGYIPSFDKLVDDVIEHYSKVKEQSEFRNLPSFLFGESMGGAIALKVHQKQPDAWNGAVLVAPMCKIADNMVPPWLVTKLLICVAKFLPTQKLVPTQDLGELAVRDAKKREATTYNIISYKHKPRLRTALELLNATQEIERLLEKFILAGVSCLALVVSETLLLIYLDKEYREQSINVINNLQNFCFYKRTVPIMGMDGNKSKSLLHGTHANPSKNRMAHTSFQLLMVLFIFVDAFLTLLFLLFGSVAPGTRY